MPDRLSIHEPVLVNTIGHSAGAVIFGILLYLFVVNWKRAREERSSLPALAAALAMLWNVGALVALASGGAGGAIVDVIVAASFSVLSMLPAVLLHISLNATHRVLRVSGYVLGFTAVALHVGDLVTQAPRFHHAALLLVTLGFGALTIVSVLVDVRYADRRAAGSRLAGAMCLALFAISFVHFGADHPGQAWSGEILVHHAGLPLALFVLLQDYRFLLLDAFVRFIVNASLTAGAVLLVTRGVQSRELSQDFQDPFDAGLLFAAACLLLIGFAYLRSSAQRLVTRVIFLRANVEETLAELRDWGRAASTDAEYLAGAAEAMARFLRAEKFTLSDTPPRETASWVRAVVPLRFSRGDSRVLLLGPRQGGRRYLSEDYEILTRLAATVVEHVEQRRAMELQSLVSDAELRALQAQINPHFLFNSLNTLYGTIARENAEARRLVLNLADVFRYFLRSDRPFIRVAEELKIVRAYLEIEELRLGSKLTVELEVDDGALEIEIPVLSIQPLVENAVKHGVASRAGNGFVRLAVKSDSERLVVKVSNSGEFVSQSAGGGSGVGLANVRRRLALHYGAAATIDVSVSAGVTTVSFAVPLTRSQEISVAV